jgi:hypothetical protein
VFAAKAGKKGGSGDSDDKGLSDLQAMHDSSRKAQECVGRQ